MKSFAFTSSVLAALLTVTGMGVAASAEVGYRLTPVVVDPQMGSLFPTDLNNRGAVIGPQIVGEVRSFIWRKGESVDLGAVVDPSTPYIEATGVNDRSNVIGFYLDSQTWRSFLLREEEVIRIEALEGETAVFVQAINDRGQIIGTTEDAEHRGRPFVWERGEVMLLEPLAGGAAAGGRRINERGTVVGSSESAAGQRAVIWRDGEVIDLGVLPGAINLGGLDINDHGQVVGQVQFAVDEGEPADFRAFLWERGLISELPHVSGAFESTPLSINNAGDIVGFAFVGDPTAPTKVVAVLWDNGVAVDLNDRIRDDDPLRPFVTLVQALVINDRGQIAVQGHDSRTNSQRAYLLSPSH
jgi:probable HAF family extracellular repeat protein